MGKLGYSLFASRLDRQDNKTVMIVKDYLAPLSQGREEDVLSRFWWAVETSRDWGLAAHLKGEVLSLRRALVVSEGQQERLAEACSELGIILRWIVLASMITAASFSKSLMQLLGECSSQWWLRH